MLHKPSWAGCSPAGDIQIDWLIVSETFAAYLQSNPQMAWERG